jgi:hypothetical protein
VIDNTAVEWELFPYKFCDVNQSLERFLMRLNAEFLNSLLSEDLANAGFSGADDFYPGQTSRDAAMMSLSNALTKKFHQNETDDSRDQLALDLFLKCNEQCKSFTVRPQTSIDELVISEMKSIIYDFFNPPPGFVIWSKVDDFVLYRDREPYLLTLAEIANRMSFGTGSNIGAPSTDSYSKYVNSDMSTTDPSLLMLYKHAVSGDRLLSEIELFRWSNYKSRTVEGNKLSFVPKSTRISRTICTEPALNMLYQKGIGELVHDRLREVWNIDFRVQPERNATLARIGSLTGRFGTIDLSSASDTISIGLLNELFELVPTQRAWFLRTRSPKTILPDGKTVELHMVSSMGNGFTFPLQTLIFSSLIAAVYKTKDISLRCYGEGRNFSVFGDDIIVVREAYDLVIHMLEVLGFSPNRKKSFNDGFFRESCGSDFYQGRNIRGVYLKVLETPGDFYSAINRLNVWSAVHRIPLTGLVSYLAESKLVRKSYVPFDESDDAGLKVPMHLVDYKRNRNGSIRYTALTTMPRSIRLPTASQYEEDPIKAVAGVARRLRNFKYCSSGILLALLAGWLRSGKLTVRSAGRPKTVLRRRVCPCWDSSIPKRLETVSFDVSWKLYVELNLSLSKKIKPSWQ